MLRSAGLSIQKNQLLLLQRRGCGAEDEQDMRRWIPRLTFVYLHLIDIHRCRILQSVSLGGSLLGGPFHDAVGIGGVIDAVECEDAFRHPSPGFLVFSAKETT